MATYLHLAAASFPAASSAGKLAAAMRLLICQLSRSMPLFVRILLHVLRRQERTGKRLLDALSSKTTSQAFARYFAQLFCAWDRSEQGRNGLAAGPGQLVEQVAVEVERAALLHRVQEHLPYCPQHACGLVGAEHAHSRQGALVQPKQEGPPALL